MQSGYQRESISSKIEIEPSELDVSNKRIIKKLKDENNEDLGLSISIIIRSHKDKNKKYLTVSLVNTNLASKEKILVNKCFFQSNFFIHAKNISDKIFHSFEQININKLSQEEKSLNLLHHNRKSYAIGHGCAPSWKKNQDGQFIIQSEIIPVFETKPIQAQEFKDLELNMKKFSEDIDFAILQSKKLSEKYSSWIDQEISKGKKFSSEVFKKTSEINTEKCKNILKRINQGISILKKIKLLKRRLFL